MANVQERDLSDVNKILRFSKLTENDIIPTSQPLYFLPENVTENNYLLVELNNELLKVVDDNQPLLIKGRDEDEVVICSESSTFQVKEAETSNSLLLVRALKFCTDLESDTERTLHKVEVHSIFQEYLEPTLGVPHLKRLYDLLSDSLYKGPEHEFEVADKKLYTSEDLKDLVQASNKEILDAIRSMDVVEIEEKIRLLDFEYHFRVLSYMLKLIEENSWELDNIDYEETCDALKDLIPIEIIKSLFEKYTEESKILDGLQLYHYKERDICIFFAKVLLREAGKFNLDEFLQAWKESVPEGMVPNEEMLNGIAIINRKSIPNVIWAFEENNLPDNIIERLKVLFKAKEKWTVPEITPYIRRLATNKLDVNALLAKYARASKVNGIKCYSAKHGR